MSYEEQYLELCQKILDDGTYSEDRTGTGTYSIFGATTECDLSTEFPILTCKKINPILPIGELLWMLSGNTDLPSLRKYQNKVEGTHTIWSDDYNKFVDTQELGEYTLETESLGRIYGMQLRNQYKVNPDYQVVLHDQLLTLISNIKAVVENPNHPMARRLICSFWDSYDHTVGDKTTCALPACHTDFQCIVRNGKLNLRFSMRSNDVFLGKPFNKVFYATLCHILARLCGLEVGKLLYFGTDVHIYKNHLEQVKEIISRERVVEVPRLVLPKFDTLDELLQLTGKDFIIENYNPHGFVKAPQAS